MVVIIFNLFFLPRSSGSNGPIDSSICTSENQVLKCHCKDREDFVMHPSQDFGIRRIEVIGCASALIPFGSVTQLELDEIHFSLIDKLIIQPYAFFGAASLYTLLIENIENFVVSPAGFAGLLNVSDITIRNISSMTVEREGFAGLSSVDLFTIKKTNVLNIKRKSVILTNITTFEVADTNIVTENNSFLIHNAKYVSFQNCSIQNTYNRSFSMAYVDSVTFSDCNIGTLDTNSVYLKYLGSLQFESCTVTELNKYAFFVEDLVKGVKFTKNTIKFSKGPPINSSISTDNENLSVFTFGNSFLCNCDIYWMWITEEPFYDMKSSFCIGTDISLSDIMPQLDSHGNCTALDTKNLKSDPNQKVTTNFEFGEDMENWGNMNVSSQAISTGNLLKMHLTWLTIAFRLIMFMCSM